MNSSPSTDAAFNDHPAASILSRMFPAQALPLPAGWQATALTRADYLPLVAGNVDFFKTHQNAAGAIVDPYEKKERQYSTPAFAQAAATLVQYAGRGDLLEPASRAFSFSLEALVNKTAADKHPDFYIPMMMHAHRILAPRVSPDLREKWKTQLQSLVPEETYRASSGHGNWNLVNVAGEAMRRKDGYVAPEQAQPQRAYLDRALNNQKKAFTPLGLYADPGVPLAYDAFPRLWLENMIADGAYDGAHRDEIATFLTKGALTSLLLLSPSGEWASGGRSAHHQWNEAQLAVICEINAALWAKRGRLDIAGAFKRGAHLALTSMKRWQRPTGELWIVKNYAPPANRHGFEGYSFNSQYNLLAMAMLCIAYERAADGIAERPLPSEIGGYVFDLRTPFHKVVASAGGTYVLIDTGADILFDATGLMRVHKAGVALSPFSSNSAPERHQGPAGDKLHVALTPGLQWKNDAADTTWHSLADARLAPSKPNPSNPPLVQSSEVTIESQSPTQVSFSIKYALSGPNMRPVEEKYVVNASGVDVTTRLADGVDGLTRLMFPALVSDGARDTQITLIGPRATIRRAGGILNFHAISPQGLTPRLEGPRIATRNGYVQALVADLPAGTREVRYRLDLAPENSVPNAVKE
ncbi:MAG: hypothetical protein KY445_11530 [Armatimonadetes bacterium]|nr:hypothetical protein [Armatimonadota bacterium]